MKHRQVQGLRARVAVLRKAMNAARVEYLQAQLELRTLQGNELACERLSAQLQNLLNTERPKQARKRGRSRPNDPRSGAIESPQKRAGSIPSMRSQCDAPNGRNASASCATVKAADAAAE